VRKELSKREGQRKRFRAIVAKFGSKINFRGYSDKTIMLKEVKEADTGSIVADHVWFTLTKGFEECNLSENSEIEFEARVKEYRKGYVNRRYGINNQTKDYKLSHPTKIRIV
jgi:hypothetical protein